jgi:hypothetical protein
MPDGVKFIAASRAQSRIAANVHRSFVSLSLSLSLFFFSFSFGGGWADAAGACDHVTRGRTYVPAKIYRGAMGVTRKTRRQSI